MNIFHETTVKVQRKVESCISLVTEGRPRQCHDVERQLWNEMLGLGALLMLLFLQTQAQLFVQGTEYSAAGLRWRVQGTASTLLGTMFGKVLFVRPVGRRVDDGRRAKDLPVDRALGLMGGFTPGVVLAIARLTAQLAFGSAREAFQRIHNWTPAPRSIMRMVDAVGDQAKPFWEAAPAPDGDGEILVVEVDAKGVPMISDIELARRRLPKHSGRHKPNTRRHARRTKRREVPKKRRAPGQKSKNARMAAIGVIYTLRLTPHGLEGPINKRTYTTLLGMEALFLLLKREADKRRGTKQMLFMADGQRSIWTLQKLHFPKARAVVDWYHIAERVWEGAKLILGEGSDEVAGYVHGILRRTRHGQPHAAALEFRKQLLTLPKSGPGTKWRRSRLRTIIHYLEENEPRMRYLGNRKKDLPIGTGVAEGAVRHVLGTRLDNSGMRWSLDRAEMVASLRCILVNGEWNAFEVHVAAHNNGLSPQPHAARSYNAKPKEAA